jgi:radical SAM-linked protein
VASREKVRIKFSKKEEIRFISHLDMIRVFTRAIRRAKLPVACTEGFVSREKISFSFPLALGITSTSEYADIELSNFLRPGQVKEELNRELPRGLEVTEAKDIPLKSKSLMATFTCSEYAVNLSPLKVLATSPDSKGGVSLSGKIEAFLGQKEIIIKKRIKKQMKEVDIRPFVLKVELKNSTLQMLLNMKVRPQEVLRALFTLDEAQIRRLLVERVNLLSDWV